MSLEGGGGLRPLPGAPPFLHRGKDRLTSQALLYGRGKWHR